MIIKLAPYVNVFQFENEEFYIVNNITGEKIFLTNDDSGEFVKLLTYNFQSFKNLILKTEKGYSSDSSQIKESLKLLESKGFIEVEKSNKPTDLTIELTRQCNERCRHCYIPQKDKNLYSFLSLKDALKAVDEFAEIGGEVVMLTGGEIFLYQDLLPLISHIHQKNLETYLFSNLVLLTKRFIETLKKYNVILIQTSIYGHNSIIHDGITNKTGSFERTIYSIKLLRDKGIKVRVVIVVMKSNYKYLIEIIEMLKAMDCLIGIELNITASYDTSKTNTNERLNEEELKEVLISLKDYDKSLFYKTVKVRDLNSGSEYMGYLNAPSCDGGKDSIYLTCENYICACPQLRTLSFGSMTEQSLNDILNNDQALLLRNYKNKNFTDCIKCEAQNYCKWCIGLGYTETGTIGTLSPYWCQHAFIIKEVAEL